MEIRFRLHALVEQLEQRRKRYSEEEPDGRAGQINQPPVWTERPLGKPGRIENFELLDYLTLFEVLRNLRILFLGQQRSIERLQGVVVAGYGNQLGFARRDGFDACLIAIERSAQLAFRAKFHGHLPIEALHFGLKFLRLVALGNFRGRERLGSRVCSRRRRLFLRTGLEIRNQLLRADKVGMLGGEAQLQSSQIRKRGLEQRSR